MKTEQVVLLYLAQYLNVRRESVVKSLPCMFDLFSDKLTERMWKLSSLNVGRNRTDSGLPSEEFVTENCCLQVLLSATGALK